MAKIHFQKNFPPIAADNEQSLMKALIASDIPVASSCGGEGICGKCKVQVTMGLENLSTPTEIELKLVAKYKAKTNERFSCQAKPIGDIIILDTPYW